MNAVTSGIERLAAAFQSVDWLIPPYLSLGYLSPLGAEIENASPAQKRQVLEEALEQSYNDDYLSRMLICRYSRIIVVKDFKIQISEAIESSFSGLHHAAVATMIPVIEGVVRKIAAAAQRDVGSGTQRLITEIERVLEQEKQSPHRFEERVVMIQGLRDFFADKLLKNTNVYTGMDEFNRHGILHGIFASYGVKLNFFRCVTLLDLMCFVVSYLYGGVSLFPPEETSESRRVAEYYSSLKHQKPDSIKEILRFP
jgi:hypothetical protein